MKYIPNTNHSRVPRIIGIGLLACSMLISFSCDNKTPEPDKPETQASHLEKASLKSIPPGVERATIQPLEKSTDQGNALLVVKFDQRDPRINKKSSEVALFPADKQRVVLTDSGKNGDREAGDGLFSAIIDFDFEALIKMAASSEKRFEKRQSHAVFRGREIIGVENRELMQKSFTRLQELGSAQDIIRDRTVIDLSDIFFLFDVLSIDPERSLIVTAPGVVQDPTRTIDPCTSTGNPDGVWTFKHLVSEMVSGTGVDPADFVEQWLMLWTSNQTVSSDFVAAPRSNILARVLNPWPRTASGKLDLDKSPFRLAAIVNRTDLSENLVYGSGSAGEGRFVFGVRDANAASCQFFRFSVIFEYGVEKNGCSGLKDWAQQWKALATHTLGSPEYNLHWKPLPGNLPLQAPHRVNRMAAHSTSFVPMRMHWLLSGSYASSAFPTAATCCSRTLPSRPPTKHSTTQQCWPVILMPTPVPSSRIHMSCRIISRVRPIRSWPLLRVLPVHSFLRTLKPRLLRTIPAFTSR